MTAVELDGSSRVEHSRASLSRSPEGGRVGCGPIPSFLDAGSSQKAGCGLLRIYHLTWKADVET